MYADAQAQIPDLPEGMARIYFLREKKQLLSAGMTQIHVNGIHEFDLANGSFTYVDVKPGKTTLMADNAVYEGQQKIQIDTVPGAQHYILISPNASRVASVVLFGVYSSLMKEKESMFFLAPITEVHAQNIFPTLRLSM